MITTILTELVPLLNRAADDIVALGTMMLVACSCEVGKAAIAKYHGQPSYLLMLVTGIIF
jgi:hypothetical protein